MNFDLADDKIEVKEIHTPNNGKSPFPLFLKKQILPKKYKLSHCPGMLKENEHVYQAQDMILGEWISIYNRDFLLTDCDEFTKSYYKEQLGIDQEPIKYQEHIKNRKKEFVLPPYNGFGSEIDS